MVQPQCFSTDLSKFLLHSSIKGEGPPHAGASLTQLNWEASKFLVDPLQAAIQSVAHAHAKFLAVVHGLKEVLPNESAVSKGSFNALSAHIRDGIETLEESHLQLLLCRDEMEALEGEIQRLREQDVERLRTIKELRQQLRSVQPSQRSTPSVKAGPSPNLIASTRRVEGDVSSSLEGRSHYYFVLLDVQFAQHHMEILPLVATKALTILWGVVDHLVTIYHGQRVQPPFDEALALENEIPTTPDRSTRRLVTSAMYAFADGLEAVGFATAAQEHLLAAAWDDRVLGWPDTAVVFKQSKGPHSAAPSADHTAADVATMAVPDIVPGDSPLRRPSISLPTGLLWKGLRARIGVHYGTATPQERHPSSWTGPALEKVARLTSLATGGETLLSDACLQTIPELPLCPNITLARMSLPKVRGFSQDEAIHRLVPTSLKAREFLPPSPEQFSDLSCWWNSAVLPSELVASMDSYAGEETREMLAESENKLQEAYTHVEVLSAAAHQLLFADAFHFRLYRRLKDTVAAMEKGWMATHDADAALAPGKRHPARYPEDAAVDSSSGLQGPSELQELADRYSAPLLPPRHWAAARQRLLSVVTEAQSAMRLATRQQPKSGSASDKGSACDGAVSAPLERAHSKLRLFYALTQRLLAGTLPPGTTTPRGDPLSGQDFMGVWTEALNEVFHWETTGLTEPRERFLMLINSAALEHNAGPLRSNEHALESMCGFLARLFILFSSATRPQPERQQSAGSTIQSSRLSTPSPATPSSQPTMCPSTPGPRKSPTKTPAKLAPFAINYRTQRLHAAWDARREELGRQRLEREREVEQQRMSEQKMQRQLRNLAKDLTAMLWYENHDEDPPGSRSKASSDRKDRRPTQAPGHPQTPEAARSMRRGSSPRKATAREFSISEVDRAHPRPMPVGTDPSGGVKARRSHELPSLNAGAAVVGLTFSDL